MLVTQGRNSYWYASEYCQYFMVVSAETGVGANLNQDKSNFTKNSLEGKPSHILHTLTLLQYRENVARQQVVSLTMSREDGF